VRHQRCALHEHPFSSSQSYWTRLHSDRKFTDRERLLGDLASPHISQAWHNARLVSRWRGQLRVLEQGFENLDAGVILCGPKGRVQFTNAQARRYLAEYAGVKRQIDHQLPDDLLRWVRTQELSLSRIDDAPPVRSPLVLETAGKRLVIRLLSKPGAHMILMEEEKTGPSVGAFTSFGLTAREAEVLTWIAQGKTNREIAAILGMQTGTVKKHVEHIFEKLGVETRTAAATQALANSQQEPNS
jgi:DNA-binding CsgD family transcriptional regulator